MGRKMGVVLLRLFLVSCTLKITAENPIPTYRFKVYTVDKCPLNATEFKAAANRRNCTGHSRYLCAPNKYLTGLVEFCTDTSRSLFEKGNCLRLEGTGGLNHYQCVDSFKTGCPTEPYYDEEIYRYPACFEINVDDKCFVAEKHCPERNRDSRNRKKDPKKPSKSVAALVYIYLVTCILIVIGICLGFYLKRRKENGTKTMQKDETQLGGTNETETLLDQPQNGEINKEREELPSNGEESEASSVDTGNSTLLKAETVSKEATPKTEIIDARDTETRNGSFLSGIILGPLTDLLRDILTKEVPPPILLQKVKDLVESQKNKKPLITKEQETLINKGKYTEFDISLLYILIRNCTHIPPHANRWGNTPSTEDTSVSANIERIRLIRNKYAHYGKVHISDAEYDHRWQEIFNIVQGLENYLGTPISYQNILKAFKINSMDHNQGERFIEMFLFLFRTQKELFEKIELQQKLLVTHNTKGELSQEGTILTSIKPSENDGNLPERKIMTDNEHDIKDLKAKILKTELRVRELEEQKISEEIQLIQMKKQSLKDGCLKCSSLSSFSK